MRAGLSRSEHHKRLDLTGVLSFLLAGSKGRLDALAGASFPGGGLSAPVSFGGECALLSGGGKENLFTATANDTWAKVDHCILRVFQPAGADSDDPGTYARLGSGGIRSALTPHARNNSSSVMPERIISERVDRFILHLSPGPP